MEFDFVIIGAGSAGCAAAFRLQQENVGTIAVLEAGYTNRVPQVKIPFGLAWTRGSKRDWKFQTIPQTALNGRRINVTRGKMLGGSSSINSMVWFRGRRDDFDNWNVPGWRWSDVEDDFISVEEKLQPNRFADPHPLSQAFGRLLGNNVLSAPSPERESAGVFEVNLHNGARWSAADAFLRPAQKEGLVSVFTHANVDKISFHDGAARIVHLIDGREIKARRGVVLSAGSIGSPAILMRSGVGPAQQLKNHGIEVVADSARVGQNLHDHPAVGLHFQGGGSGYGLEFSQMPHWACSPFYWLMQRKGRLASQIVEAGAFFHSHTERAHSPVGPDCQSHFIPFMVGYKNSFITWGSGYSADVNVCRPVSRGSLELTSADPKEHPLVDLALLKDPRDMETLKNGVRRLRTILGNANFEHYRAPEVYPGPEVSSDADLESFVRERCATAYHPVGTVEMGEKSTPLDAGLNVRGVRDLWVADASIMPAVTTANTNAPSMMIGFRAGGMISKQCKA